MRRRFWPPRQASLPLTWRRFAALPHHSHHYGPAAGLTAPSPHHHPPLRRVFETAEGLASSARPFVSLAIETSCDDTCVAVLENRGREARLLFNKTVTSDNRAFKGVNPVTAVESHMTRLAPLVEEAIGSLPMLESKGGGGAGEAAAATVAQTRIDAGGVLKLRRKPDLICVTRGPGMLSNLAMGLSVAKGLAVAWDRPLLGVHHMQAHALTPGLVAALNLWEKEEAARRREAQLRQPPPPPSPPPPSPAPAAHDNDPPSLPSDPACRPPQFPFLTLLVSGGHTQLLLSSSLTAHRILAESTSYAIGNMLDHCARVILPPDHVAGMRHVAYAAEMERFAFPDLAAADPAGEEKQTKKDDGDGDGGGSGGGSGGRDVGQEGDPYGYYPPKTRKEEIEPLVRAPSNGGPGWHITPPLHETTQLVFNLSGLSGYVQGIMERDEAIRKQQQKQQPPPPPPPPPRHASEEGTAGGNDASPISSSLSLSSSSSSPRPPASAPASVAPATAPTLSAATTGTGGQEKPAAGAEPEHQEPPHRPMSVSERRELARDVMQLAFEHIAGRVVLAFAGRRREMMEMKKNKKKEKREGREGRKQGKEKPIRALVVSGGVASNRFLMHVLRRFLAARGLGGIDVVSPPPGLCTDNAAMIAWAGAKMWEAGWRSSLDIMPIKSWPMDAARDDDEKPWWEKERGKGGILEVGGWLRRAGMDGQDEEKADRG